MNENYDINEVNKLPKTKSKDVFILTIFIGLFLLICAFGVYGFVCNLKSNENDTNVDYFEVVLPEKNDKFTFLNEVSTIHDNIEVTNYYYSDKETLTWFNEETNKDETREFYVLRSETFVNGVLIDDIRILEVANIEFDKINKEYELYHESRFIKDTKNDNKYVLVTLSNNSTLIQDGKYIVPYSQTPVYNNLKLQETYLVDYTGKVLKNFSYSDCWLSGIMVNKEEIGDRSSIYTDFSVYDEEKDGYVDKYGDVIYSYGSLFDVKGNYFYWLDRIDGNKEYRYSIEDGKLIEKYIKSYDYDKYDFMEVGCI